MACSRATSKWTAPRQPQTSRKDGTARVDFVRYVVRTVHVRLHKKREERLKKKEVVNGGGGGGGIMSSSTDTTTTTQYTTATTTTMTTCIKYSFNVASILINI